MFFVVNQRGEIVAASRDFLKESGSESMAEAGKLLKEGAIAYDEENALLKIASQGVEYPCSRNEIVTVLGDFTLYLYPSVERGEESLSSGLVGGATAAAAAGVLAGIGDEILESVESGKEEREEPAKQEEGSVEKEESEEDLIDISGFESESPEEESVEAEEEEKESEAEGTEDIEDELMDLLKLSDEEESVEESVAEEEKPAKSEAADEEDEELMKLLDIDLQSSEESEEEQIDISQMLSVEEDEKEELDDILEEPSSIESGVDTEESESIDEEDEELMRLLNLDLEESEENAKEDISKIEPVQEERSVEPAQSEDEDLMEILDIVQEPSTTESAQVVEKEDSLQEEEDEELFDLLEIKEIEEESGSETESSTEKVKDEEPMEVLDIEKSLSKRKVPQEQGVSEIIKSSQDEMRSPREASKAPGSGVEAPAESESVKIELDIDLEAQAKILEVPIDEYNSLLQDFISDAREMKSEFTDDSSVHSTVSILKDAILLLQLESLEKILNDIEKAPASKRNSLIGDFYVILDRIEMAIENGESRVEFSTDTENGKVKENIAEGVTHIPEQKSDERPKKQISESPKEELADKIKKEKGASISSKMTAEEILKDSKVIPIEFSLDVASQELSLPKDLVLEFISDFAKQGHENIPVLIEAYRNDELDKLQKTAHMLKGAASNLRVEQMVNNLYELQYDNNIDNAPRRIKLFVGQLMGLDNYLQQMNAK